MTATLHPRRTLAPPANRILAALIDLGIVAIAPLAAALATAERFRLLDPAAGADRFAPADQQRIDQLGRGFSRAIEWDGWLYVLDTTAWLATVAAATAAALFVSVGFPAAAGGRSPGKGLTGLRVVSGDGRPAGIGQLAVRTVAGPIDLLPVIAPGLVAAALASADPDRRRLGDRLADTRVTAVAKQWVVRSASPGSDHLESRGRLDRSERSPARPDTTIAVAGGCPPTIVLADPSPTIVTRHDPDRRLAEQLLALDSGTGTTSPTVTRPAPPLPPIRHLDGSPTRSPRSRRAATMAEIDLAEGRVPQPDATWLGDAIDYERWSPVTDDQTGRRRVHPPQIDAFDALLLAESSLAETPELATVRDVTEPGPRPLPRRVSARRLAEGSDEG